MLKDPVHEKLAAQFSDPLVKGWRSVTAMIEYFSYYSGNAWLFRGTSDASHKLIPKIGRPDRKRLSDGSGQRIGYSFKDEKAVFAAFKSNARPYISSPPTTDLEWMGLAQHYGAPTRLIDWTTGLLTAMWFATRKSGVDPTVQPTTGKVVTRHVDAAIWLTWNLRDVSKSDHSTPFAIKNIRKYRPDHYTARITAQQSVFTIQPHPEEDLSGDRFFKFTIPASQCFTIRKRLDACGVNERSVYPDLVGLGADLAWRYKNDYLAGFRSEDSSG